MLRKTIGFIVILLTYFLIGAMVEISTDNFGLGFPNAAKNTVTDHFALDRAGNIYYISTSESASALCCTDSEGRELYRTPLDPKVFGQYFRVVGIYVEHDRNIFIAGCEYNDRTRRAERLSVGMFYENGSFAGAVLSRTVSCRMSGGQVMISAFSEDGDSVYFSVFDNGRADVYSVTQKAPFESRKIADYDLSDTEIYGAYTFPSGAVAVGTEGGIEIFSDSKTSIGGDRFAHSVFDRFWNGLGKAYAMDSSNGSLYCIDHRFSVERIADGNAPIHTDGASDGIRLSEMTDISVGITGKLFGRVRAENDRLYTGSTSLLYEISRENGGSDALFNPILTMLGAGLSAILLSVLTWDFYCGILKMNLPIVIRQSLLIFLLVFFMLYFLSVFLIEPFAAQILEANYIHEVRTVADSFTDSLNSAVGGEKRNSEKYAAFLEGIGKAANAESEAAGAKPEIGILEQYGSRVKIFASTERFPPGTPADRLLFGRNINETIRSMDTDEIVFFNNGKTLLIRKFDLPCCENPCFLMTAIEKKELNENVNAILSRLRLFLLIGGATLTLLFILIEVITARSLRKLKKTVDRITRGEKFGETIPRSGDEIEALFKSVWALSEHIDETTRGLRKLNSLYYRFVPLSFLKHIGETRIENIGKSLSAKKHTAMLSLSFRFSKPVSRMRTDEIFRKINAVYELLLPVVSEYGGTAYNFRYNGFQTIFSESPKQAEQALLMAIRIRERAEAYNRTRSDPKAGIDVRIVIGEDDVLLGFVGEEARMEPTVVSEFIAEASEIETLCAESGLYLLCAESAFKRLPTGKYRGRLVGNYECANGRSVRLYDLYDSDPYPLMRLKDQYLQRFTAAVRSFEKGDYPTARSEFMDIVKYAPNDGVSRNYLYLSEYNVKARQKLTTYRLYENIDFEAVNDD